MCEALLSYHEKLRIDIDKRWNVCLLANPPHTKEATALFYAINYRHEDVCKVLLKHGASANAPFLVKAVISKF
jgi:hypothetical protein